MNVRHFLELQMIGLISGPRHYIRPEVWARFTSTEQDRLRRAADDAGTEIWVVTV